MRIFSFKQFLKLHPTFFAVITKLIHKLIKFISDILIFFFLLNQPLFIPFFYRISFFFKIGDDFLFFLILIFWEVFHFFLFFSLLFELFWQGWQLPIASVLNLFDFIISFKLKVSHSIIFWLFQFINLSVFLLDEESNFLLKLSWLSLVCLFLSL